MGIDTYEGIKLLIGAPLLQPYFKTQYQYRH